MTLEEYLKKYKALTLNIIEAVDKDGNIKFLYDEREKILEVLKNSDFDKDEMKKIGKELKLIELENEMLLNIKKEKVNIKVKIQNLRKMNQGNSNYMSLGYVPSRFNKYS